MTRWSRHQPHGNKAATAPAKPSTAKLIDGTWRCQEHPLEALIEHGTDFLCAYNLHKVTKRPQEM